MKKRKYHSEARLIKALQTKQRILNTAKSLFVSEGFECVTIEKLAQNAQVSAPTIYSLFQSKRGVLRAVINEAFSFDPYEALLEESRKAPSAKESLMSSAKIARHLYDTEREQMDIFRSASVLAPEFKQLEKEREEQRYSRQMNMIHAMNAEKVLRKELSSNQARDILWALTSREIYRMLVVERGWSSEEYERWLGEFLIKFLVKG